MPGVKNDRKALHAWAMYDWANSAYSTVIAGAVLPVFFVSVVVTGDTYRLFGREWAPDGLWAMVAGTGPLLMFLVVPVMGAIADFTASKRRFLMFFAMVGSAFTVLLFLAAPGRVMATIGLFLLAEMGFVAANVFYDGFLPDLTTDDTIDRESSRGFALGYIGGGLYLLLAVIAIFAEPFGAELTTRLAVAGAGVWWMGFSLWAIPRIPETGASQPIPARLAAVPRPLAYLRIGFGRTWETTRRLRHFPHLLLFVVAFILYNDGVQTTIAVSAAYAGSTLQLDVTVVVLAFLIVQFIAYFGALAFGHLAGRVGTKPALLISLVVWTGIAVAAFFLPTGAVAPFLAVAVVIGFVLGGVQALSRSLYGSMIPEEASAEFYGFYSVFRNSRRSGGRFCSPSSGRSPDRPVMQSSRSLPSSPSAASSWGGSMSTRPGPHGSAGRSRPTLPPSTDGHRIRSCQTNPHRSPAPPPNRGIRPDGSRESPGDCSSRSCWQS